MAQSRMDKFFENAFFESQSKIRDIDLTEPATKEECQKAMTMMGNFDEVTHIARMIPSELRNYSVDCSKNTSIISTEEAISSDLKESFKKKKKFTNIRFERIGSTADGLKINFMDESDRLCIIDVPEGLYPDGRHYKRKEGYKKKLSSKEYREDFASSINSYFEEVGCPEKVIFAGLIAPEYSGVRFSGPACTVLFEWQLDEKESESMAFSQDYTIALELTEGEETVRIKEKMNQLQEWLSNKVLNKCSVCLVPDPISEDWVVSTAFIEANLFRDLGQNAPIKQASIDAKIIIDKLNKYNLDRDMSSSIGEEPANIKKAFDELNNQTEEEKKKAMKYGHLFLSTEKAKQMKELSKFGVAINTIAIRHILLNKCIEEGQALAFKDVVNEGLVDELIKHAFTQLSNPNMVKVPNAFLGEPHNIAVFSISPLAVLKLKLPIYLHIIREECRIVAENIFARRETSTSIGKRTTSTSFGLPKAKRPRNENVTDSVRVESIQDALNDNEHSRCSFKAVVVDKSNHTEEDGENVFYIWLSDESTQKAEAKVTKSDFFLNIIVGKTYDFQHVTREVLSNGLHIDETSELYRIKENISGLDDVPQQDSTKNAPRTLAQALVSQMSSTVKGIIVFISGIRYAYGTKVGDLTLRHVYLVDPADADRPTKVTVFNEDVNNGYLVKGNYIQITEVMAEEFGGNLSLKLRKNLSKITRANQDPAVENIDITSYTDKIEVSEENEIEEELTIDRICTGKDSVKNFYSNIAGDQSIGDVEFRVRVNDQSNCTLAMSDMKRCGIKGLPGIKSFNGAEGNELLDAMEQLLPLKFLGVIGLDDDKVKLREQIKSEAAECPDTDQSDFRLEDETDTDD